MLLSFAFAVIVTVPFFFPVTFPLLTVAIDLLLDDHLTFLLVAFAGWISAFNCIDLLTDTLFLPVILIELTFTVLVFLVDLLAFFTLTLYVPFVLLPSFAVAVIVTVPFFFPVTLPLLLTVAIDLSLDDHLTM